MTSSVSPAALAAGNLNVVIDLDDEATKAKIQALIANPPLNSRVIKITPVVAEWILETYNKHNRPKKRGKIDAYAADMAAGEWKLTGDTGKFTKNGLLGDMQNRLAACVQAGTPFTTHVVFGIPDEFFPWLDRGKNRTGADALFINNLDLPDDKKLPYPSIFANAVRWAYLLENNPKSRETFEPSEILKLGKEYAALGLIDWIQTGVQIHRRTKFPAGMATAILYQAEKKSRSAAMQFAKGWTEGIDTRITPLRKMIQYTAETKAQPGVRIHDTVRAAWAVLAWNQFRKGGRASLQPFQNWTMMKDFPDFE